MAADIITLGDLPSTSKGALTLVAQDQVAPLGVEQRRVLSLENPVTNKINLDIYTSFYEGHPTHRGGISLVVPDEGTCYLYKNSLVNQPIIFIDTRNDSVGIYSGVGLNRFGVAGNITIGSFSWVSNLGPSSGLSVEKNVGIGTYDEFGGGTTVLGMANATVAPTITPIGGGVLWVEGGELKYMASSGNVTVVGPL
jgi:hypothetical protein